MVKVRCKCGVYGIWSNKSDESIIDNTLKGLQQLQHRGRESCGISYITDKSEMVTDKTHGLVKDLQSKITKTTKKAAIGHVRYSTSGSKIDVDAIQPIQNNNIFSLAHNGNIPNIDTLKAKLSKQISLMYFCKNISKKNDTGVLAKILELKGIETGIQFFLEHIPGSYSLLILTHNGMYLVRDPCGFKPLCFTNVGDTWYAASETTSLPKTTEPIVNVSPGSVYRIDKYGAREILRMPAERKSICSFEFIYFMYYKTVSDTLFVNDIRHKIGQYMVDDDTNKYPPKTIVIGSPNSGISYAKAYSRRSGIPYVQSALRKERKERTFILPTNGERISKIKKIMIADRRFIEGNEVILVDDSIVRGNTIRHVIQLLRDNGATRVHIKVAFPKIISPCYYGIDFPSYGELIGHNKTDDEICAIIGADTLQYTEVHALKRALINKNGDVCVSCLTDSHTISEYDW